MVGVIMRESAVGESVTWWRLQGSAGYRRIYIIYIYIQNGFGIQSGAH
jgi:hypothetical protein